jgi:hypothetical protein
MFLKKQNRIKSKQATKHKFWCDTCDAARRGEHGKCPNCGSKSVDSQKCKKF